MTASESSALVADTPTASPDPPEHPILRAAAQLAGTAILAGSLVTLGGFALATVFPLVSFVIPFTWLLLPAAAVSGGLAGGAALGVVRAVGRGIRTERWIVLFAAAVGSVPPLLSVSALFAGGVVGQWWSWIVVATLAAAFGHHRTLRHPMDQWRPVLVRLLVGLGLTLGGVAFFALPFTRVWNGGYPTFLAFAGVIALAGILISLGPFGSRSTAGVVWAGFAMLVASIVAVMVGVSLQSYLGASVEPPTAVPSVWAGDGADWDATTDLPRDPDRADVPAPALEEGRSQFAALAAAAIDAAGPEATWRDDPPMAVREIPCDGGGTILRIDAEFAMGEVTDTTSDEHDRAVTEANLAAADRIVLAWPAAGLGTPEVLHGEPILGGATMASVDWTKIDFAFGVAQPRIEGRCLPGE